MARPVLRLVAALVILALPVGLGFFLARKAAPPTLSFHEVTFSDLKGWQEDHQVKAFEAFLKTCETLVPRPGFRTPEKFKTEEFAMAFQDACRTAVEGGDYYSKGDAEARTFFEKAFTPYLLKTGWSKRGLITGYYEARIEVSKTRDETYKYPIYGAPGDQVAIDPGAFRDGLSGTWIGRVAGKKVVPYFTRSEIGAGALKGKKLEILWAKDPVSLYFLQVQGSGRAILPDGTVIGIGYAGKNGHPNTLAGRTLVQQGFLKKDDVSMKSIRTWFEEHPDKIDDILNHDDSYVFFRITEEGGPFGSAGAELTPERSLAVDVANIPLGLPVWVTGDAPDPGDPAKKTLPFDHLMIAQDTGGVIKGKIRGDVFWGFGPRAEAIAGHMKNKASFSLLVPNGFTSGR